MAKGETKKTKVPTAPKADDGSADLIAGLNERERGTNDEEQPEETGGQSPEETPIPGTETSTETEQEFVSSDETTLSDANVPRETISEPAQESFAEMKIRLDAGASKEMHEALKQEEVPEAEQAATVVPEVPTSPEEDDLTKYPVYPKDDPSKAKETHEARVLKFGKDYVVVIQGTFQRVFSKTAWDQVRGGIGWRVASPVPKEVLENYRNNAAKK